jgi:hypothetical protein
VTLRASIDEYGLGGDRKKDGTSEQKRGMLRIGGLDREYFR